jgi:FAD-dependent oxidoreductase domain-containing protein 1
MQHSVVIIGGGVMGAATACFLARDHGARVTVLERDPTYRRASSALSASSIRQQFSTPVNIELSAWSMAFLRRLARELAVDGAGPDIGLTESGYLYLTDTEAGAAALRRDHALQRSMDVQVALLDPPALRQRLPWISTEGVVLASLGLRGEGWFDGPALMQAFRRKAIACGARFVQAEVDGFVTRGGQVLAARAADGRQFEADAFVLAAGAWSAPLAADLGIHLPVAARKRDVFVLDAPVQLADGPLLIDPSGVWCRPEGRGYIAGAPPRAVEAGGPGDPDDAPLETIDHALFDEVIWPALARRVPAFEALRVRSAWAGYYEMNLHDHNGLAGPLPGWRNAYTACGFSGHGMQQAPAVGCALAALVMQAPCAAPDLVPLHPSRLSAAASSVEARVI